MMAVLHASQLHVTYRSLAWPGCIGTVMSEVRVRSVHFTYQEVQWSLLTPSEQNVSVEQQNYEYQIDTKCAHVNCLPHCFRKVKLKCHSISYICFFLVMQLTSLE